MSDEIKNAVKEGISEFQNGLPMVMVYLRRIVYATFVLSIILNVVLILIFKKSTMDPSAENKIKELTHKIELLESGLDKVIYIDRPVIVERIKTNTVILSNVEAKINEKTSAYGGLTNYLDAVRYYQNTGRP